MPRVYPKRRATIESSTEDTCEDTSAKDTDDDDKSGEEEYVVESILAHRRHNGVIKYLVKWEGYPISDATYEGEENLANCRLLLAAYKQKKVTPPSSPIVKLSTENDSTSAKKTKRDSSPAKKRESASTTPKPKKNLSTPKSNGNRRSPSSSTRIVRLDSESSQDRRSPPSIPPPTAAELMHELEANVDETISDEIEETSEDSETDNGTGNESRLDDDDEPHLPDLIPKTDESSSNDSASSASSGTSSPEICRWKEGWVAKKVMGVTRYPDGTLWVLIAWKNPGVAPELIPNYIANEKIPEMMIAYYEHHLKWQAYKA